MKNYLGECSLKVTRPNGECSESLGSNPALFIPLVLVTLAAWAEEYIKVW